MALVFKPTPIDKALQLAWAAGEELAFYPIRREPRDPVVEATVAKYWAGLSEERRAEFRQAFALLNIPMQENLP